VETRARHFRRDDLLSTACALTFRRGDRTKGNLKLAGAKVKDAVKR